MGKVKAGEKLRTYRRKAGYTLRQLSKLTGIPFTTINSYEKGRAKLQGKALNKFANLFRVNPEDLEDDDETTEREENYRRLLKDLLLKVTYEVPVYESSSIDGKPIYKIEIPLEIARKIDIVIKSIDLTLVEEGIIEGTLMLVRRTSYPEKGDIVLLKKNSDLKIIKLEEGVKENWINSNYPSLNGYEIFGVVLYLFREVRKP